MKIIPSVAIFFCSPKFCVPEPVTSVFIGCRLRLKCDGTRAETRFRLSAKRTSPFKSTGPSVQSTTSSRGVRISGSNAGYSVFRGSVKGTGCTLIRQFTLHFPSHASPCAITFQLGTAVSSTTLFPTAAMFVLFVMYRVVGHQVRCVSSFDPTKICQ